MSLFTPVTGLFGGSLIGLSAATLLLGNGDILGLSGIVSSSILNPRKTLSDPSQKWKISFLASFLITVQLYVNFVDSDMHRSHTIGYGAESTIVSPLGYTIAGFLTGFGTRLGNGCTSGHGICGLARLSKRSLFAVVSFMTTGILSSSMCGSGYPMTMYLRTSPENALLPTDGGQVIGHIITFGASWLMISGLLSPEPSLKGSDTCKEHEEKVETNQKRKAIVSSLSASLFALGLVISEMTKSSKVYGFLDLRGLGNGTHDPTLLTVMAGGLLISFLSYQLVPGFNILKNRGALESPIMMKQSCGHFNVPSNKIIDFKLIFGASNFGLGWGLGGGLCPGSALFLAGAGFPHIIFRWWPSFILGAFLGEHAKTIL